jgi:hypothetical protein
LSPARTGLCEPRWILLWITLWISGDIIVAIAA